jgi:biopolymer transport protein ExbD
MMKLGSDTDEDLMTEMNTTPLIDVMLVLLVMLIITIPIQLHSVNMNLPKPTAQQVQSKPVVIKIEVTASNQMLWDGQTVADKAALKAKLEEVSHAFPDVQAQPEIHIKASDMAKYDTVASVLAAAQRAGLRKIGIVGGSTVSTQP